MRRVVIALLLTGLLGLGAGQAAAETKHKGMKPEETQHSGRIVSTSPGEKTIALEELGARGRPMRRMIEVTPDTKVERVARSTDRAPGQWPGDFTRTPLPATELKPGEFVTVKTAKRDGRLIAVEITVVALPTAPTAAAPGQRSSSVASGA